MIYVSGSECIGRCGQLPSKGSASSDLHQFVRIAQIKSLNSNCVLVLMFHWCRIRKSMINFSSLERLSLEEPMPKISIRANALLLISSEKEWV